MARKSTVAASTPTSQPALSGVGADATQRSVPPMRLSYLIGQLDRVISRRLAEALVLHGLTLPQYTALSVLRARGRSSNAQIAERSFITPQSANEVVKTMEASGWVAREPDPMNRRVVLLSLTDAGKTLLDACDQAVDQVERAMLDDVAPTTAQTLQTLLHTCVRNLRAI
jgi:DNA-binding MarR family transcriptional regulator